MKSQTKTYAVFIFLFYSVAILSAQIRSDFVLVPIGETPHLKSDGNSRIHATWSSDGSVYYGLFDSLGNEINMPKKSRKVVQHSFHALLSMKIILLLFGGGCHLHSILSLWDS